MACNMSAAPTTHRCWGPSGKQEGLHWRNGHALTNHEPLLPPCGQHGRRRGIPAEQREAPGQVPPPSTTQPRPLHPSIPRSLPSQIRLRPVSLPETTGRKEATEPWSFLLGQKLLYTEPSLPSTAMQTPNNTQNKTQTLLYLQGEGF